MTKARKQKVEEAKKLLSRDKTSVFANVTEQELAYLQKHHFDAANFLKYETSSIFTDNAEAKAKCSAILAKIDFGHVFHVTLPGDSGTV